MAPEDWNRPQPGSSLDDGDGPAAGTLRDSGAQPSASARKAHNFEVHALGPTGAGKTVFMASLYKRLNIKRPELPFFLKSDYRTGLQLNHTYNQIANADEGWPSPTQQIMEWNFTACLSTQRRRTTPTTAGPAASP